jgi:hypothetical protein
VQEFHDGVYDSASSSSAARPSLRFLRAASDLQASKEIEMVVLQLLLQLDRSTTDEAAAAVGGRLLLLYRVALWMMLVKLEVRVLQCNRCFDMIQSLHDGGRGGAAAFALSAEKRAAARWALSESDFGATPQGKKTAKAVLLRLNEHDLLLHSPGNVLQPDQALQIEHEYVLPVALQGTAWMAEWEGRGATRARACTAFANLFLLDRATNAKLGNTQFARKLQALVDSQYPLTKAVGRAAAWDPPALKAQHEALVEHAERVWDLA